MTNSKWSIIQEKKVESKGQEVIASYYLNRIAEKHYSNRDDLLTSISVILLFLISFFKQEKVFDESVRYVAAGLALLKLFQSKILNYNGKATIYRTTKEQYDKIIGFICEELAKHRSDRMSPNDMMIQLVKDINNINKGAPEVPDAVINKFYKKYKNLKTAKPLTVNQIEIIVNNSEDIPNIETDENKEVAASVIQDVWKKHKNKEDNATIQNIFAKEMKSRISKNRVDNSFHYEMRRFKNSEDSEEKSEDKN